ncbi:winged helix-turn-helix transcriptional regulator [Streptomyces sp. NRRL F-5123]|uniref:winged helix-turn-helix transcriptional regulator n=1 Tax=Streptomyces sp. NRRL F-5123 TaxID=1463856 RepID=UPI000694C4C5|nr:helix-turn-helix domain-containing protein [Streptomyces sp. NRRL F-5123]
MSTDSRTAGDHERGPLVTAEAYDTCPVTGVLRTIGDRWSPAVIRVLAERPCGFNELDRAIERISRRMLTRTLRALEDGGLVDRTPCVPAGSRTPSRVEYALTARGRSLREQLRGLGVWAAANT